MRRLYVLILLLSLCLGAFSQEITVRFTGQLNGTSYCRLESVAVTNLTRGWTETVEYPDTIIVLFFYATNVTDLNIAATQGLGQNIPNPFDCETRVELSVSQRENVRMQLLDASGKQYAEYSGSLDAGVHTFDISAAAPQTYVLNATVGSRSYSIRMVNMGSGCGSSIKYAGISGSITAKLTTYNEFFPGDYMRYVGYATVGGQMLTSESVVQEQYESQYVTLYFTSDEIPIVQTLSATEITSSSASINGNVVSAGGASVTERGFVYGTNSSNLTQNVQSGSGTGNFMANLTGLTSGTTYYYKAYATNSAGTAYGELMSFTTENSGATTGSLNGHDWVDLGLPSGTLWATCNVGANSPTAYGDYYAWGETTTKTTYNWSTYIYCNGNYNTLTKYCNDASYGNNGFTDALTTLEATDDAATANWGSGWRMPTYDEMLELYNNCTKTWTTQNGVNGIKFTGTNGNSVFLPAAGHRLASELSNAGSVGYYWSSSLRTNAPYKARNLFFNSGTCYLQNYDNDRRYGQSVRPVCVSASSTTSALTVTTNSASGITAAVATLSGNVTSDGGATVTARGFRYGTNSSNLSQIVQSGSGTGSFTAKLTGLISGTTYYYKAYATNSEGTAYGEIRSFTTLVSTGTQNGHDWVDLGLPSGTRWATCNVGASTPTAYGNYYAWGETTTKTTYNWSTYIYCNGSNRTLTKYCSNSSYGNNEFTDNLTTLEASDDAATANWGTGWRMPTYDELNELKNNCTVTWTTQNGVNGRLFTGPNGNSIFLPAAGYRNDSVLYNAGSSGYYWSSSLYTGGPYLARDLSFGSDGYDMGDCGRHCGQSVRPVCVSQN